MYVRVKKGTRKYENSERFCSFAHSRQCKKKLALISLGFDAKEKRKVAQGKTTTALFQNEKRVSLVSEKKVYLQQQLAQVNPR